MPPQRKRASSPANAVQGQNRQTGISRSPVGTETSVSAGALRDPAYMTVQAAADWLSLSDAAVRKLLTQKLLRRFKVCGAGSGRRTLVLFDEVKSLVSEVK